jgi:hypothetical protein
MVTSTETNDAQAARSPRWWTFAIAVVSFVVAATASLAASPDYKRLLAVAMAMTIVHFYCAWLCIRAGRSRLRFALLFLSIPLFIVALDNVRRVVAILARS